MANLAALLDQEASAEIEAILSEARQRASEIVAKAKDEAEAFIAQRERALATQHEAALVRAKSAAQLEAASLKLRAQHQAVEGVFDKADAEICALIKDKKRYQPVLLALLNEAVASLGEDGAKVATVVVNPADKELVEAEVAKLVPEAELAVDERLQGGVRLRTAGTNIVVENTLPSRLATLRDDLASDVSRVLLSDDQAT